MRNVFGMLVGLGVVLATSSALAQQPTDPNQPGAGGQAGGQVGGQAGGQVNAGGELPAPKPVVTPPPTYNTAPVVKDDKKDDGITDHEKVVGKFGVMYFGINDQPIGAGAANNVQRRNVPMPVIGMRYWLQERLGIDAGLGFMMTNQSGAVQQNGQPEQNTDGEAIVAFGLHGGLPLAFAYGKHYKFLLVPEVNFGYATQTEAAQNVPPGQVSPSDIHRTGFRFDIGARVGTEIQFGFIGIPELALQASVGLNFRRRVWHASRDAAPPAIPNPLSSSDGQNDFGTTVQSDPWALFVNNISAIYYFP
jgi:hypothetical protein